MSTTTPTIRMRTFGRDSNTSSSGEPTIDETLTLLRGRMRGWCAPLRHDLERRGRRVVGLGCSRSPRMG